MSLDGLSKQYRRHFNDKIYWTNVFVFKTLYLNYFHNLILYFEIYKI